MTSCYTIEKVGNEYVVKVDDQSVMTVRNRRKAVRLVAVASDMLGQAAVPNSEASAKVRPTDRS